MGEKLTKAEWEQVEEHTKSFYSPVALMCDGFHVILKLERISAFKNNICVYVNGRMVFNKETHLEETRRFCFPSVRFMYSGKQRASWKKEPKWLLKEMGIKPDRTYTTYLPFWGSFKSLKAHLGKNNENIELLKDWKYVVEPKGEGSND
jgi:hypothetical protein